MQLDEVINKRRSIRKFLTQLEISNSDLFKLIEAAIKAPSIGDIQPWQFIITKDRKKIDEISKIAMQGWILSANTIILIVANEKIIKYLYGKDYKEHLNQSIGACVENLLLKAEELDIGATWVSYFDRDKMNKLFGVPEGKKIVAFVALGFKDEKASEKKLKDKYSLVFFEKYGEFYQGKAK